jgi:hypothetical protein
MTAAWRERLEPSRHTAVETAVMELGNQQSRIKAARCYARAAFSFERSELRSRASSLTVGGSETPETFRK